MVNAAFSHLPHVSMKVVVGNWVITSSTGVPFVYQIGWFCLGSLIGLFE